MQTLKRITVLACLLAVSAPSATRGQEALMGQTLSLLSNKRVHEDLKLDPGQLNEIKRLAGDLRSEQGGEFAAKAGGGLNDSKKELATAEGILVKRLIVRLGSILSPTQMARFKQIVLHSRGVEIFLESDLIATLKLTPSQRGEIRKISVEAGALRDRILLTDPYADHRKEIETLRQQSRRKVIALFDDAQKRTWETMSGPAFKPYAE